MRYNFALVKWISTVRPIFYNVIGTSILVAISINILTSLLFLNRNDLDSYNIVLLVVGSFLLLLSGYEFINLGWRLTGFIPKVMHDTSEIARKNLSQDELQQFAEILDSSKNGPISRKQYIVWDRAVKEASRRNIDRVGHEVQPPFLIAIFSLAVGLALIFASSPLLH